MMILIKQKKKEWLIILFPNDQLTIKCIIMTFNEDYIFIYPSNRCKPFVRKINVPNSHYRLLWKKHKIGYFDNGKNHKTILGVSQ